jgi:hypothetical protein
MKSISPKHRYPSGQIVEAETSPIKETVDQVLSLVKWQREKFGASAENYRDQKWSTPLGKLRLWAIEGKSDSFGLSERQYAAVVEYVRDRHLSRWAEGFGPEHPKSLSIGDLGGRSLSDGPDDETVYRLRSKHNSAKSALLEYAGRGVAWVKIMDDLATDRHTDSDWKPLIGEARSAANILVKHYRIS